MDQLHLCLLRWLKEADPLQEARHLRSSQVCQGIQFQLARMLVQIEPKKITDPVEKMKNEIKQKTYVHGLRISRLIPPWVESSDTAG